MRSVLIRLDKQRMSNWMTSGEENLQRNLNWEGEESECMSVFSVCLYVFTRNG